MCSVISNIIALFINQTLSFFYSFFYKLLPCTAHSVLSFSEIFSTVLHFTTVIYFFQHRITLTTVFLPSLFCYYFMSILFFSVFFAEYYYLYFILFLFSNVFLLFSLLFYSIFTCCLYIASV